MLIKVTQGRLEITIQDPRSWAESQPTDPRDKSKLVEGTVSHGTLRSYDLFWTFAEQLATYNPMKLLEILKEIPEAKDDVSPYQAIQTDWADGLTHLDIWCDDYVYWDTAQASEVVNELLEALMNYGDDTQLQFRNLEGDASDFGWWPIEEDED